MKLGIDKKTLILLVAIVILGAGLRLFALGENSFQRDEFLDINASYGYFKTDQWQAWDFNRDDVAVRVNVASDERAWAYRGQVATIFQFLTPTERNARLASALWGIAHILILFCVTLSLTRNRATALLAAFFFSVNIAAIEMDRTLRMYAMFAPIFLLFSWTVFQFLERPANGTNTRIYEKLFGFLGPRLRAACSAAAHVNYLYLVPMVLLGLLSFHLHALTGNIALVLLVYFAAMLIVTHRVGGDWLNCYAVYLTKLLGLFLLAILLAPQLTMQFTGALTFFENHWSYVGHVLDNFWHPLAAALLMILGGWHLIRAAEQKAGVWIVSTFATLLAAAIFLWERNAGAQYIFFAQSFAIILLAAGVHVGAKFLHTQVYGKKIYAITIGLALLLLPAYPYFFQENNTYHTTSRAEAPNYRKVFGFVKRNFTEGDVMITRNVRNYYYAGLNARVFDFGSERDDATLAKEGKVSKITLTQVEDIVSGHPSGWVVFSDNDEKFIEKEARAYFEQNFEKVNDIAVRGKISVYRWGSSKN